MGIRFLCPNGHKLNVKAFLAGKRGICPDCDAKFIVPEMSGAMAVPVDSADPSAVSDLVGPAAQEIATPVEPPPAVASDAIPPAIDQSLPDTWYVRPVSGEQYGPANTQLIQAWAAEGRIADDSWVWRTGWDKWKIAHEVFDLLKPAPPLEEATIPVASPDALQIESQKVEGALASKLRKPKISSRKEKARRISVALGSLVFVLAMVLALVLWYQK